MKVLRILSFVLCLILGMTSTESFAFVNYDEWEGDVSSDWNDANNWEGNSLPASNQAARIGSSGFTYAPVISSNSSFTPRYLVVQGGDTLTIEANLSTSRDFFIGQGAALIINDGNVSTGTNRDLNIRNEDTKVIVNGGTLTITDDLYLDRLLDIVPGADPTLEVNGGTVLVGGDVRFDGIFAEKPTLLIQGGTVDVSGSLFNDGADVTLALSSDSLIVRGDIDMNGSADSLLMTGGVLYLTNDGGSFTNDGIVACTGGEVVFQEDYTLDGTGSTQFHDVTIISGTGALSQDISQINISGDIQIDGSFTPNTNDIHFNGSSPQVISGASSLNLYDANLDNSNGLSLSTDVNVLSGGNLTFTSGILQSDSTNTLSFNDGGTCSGQSASSYVSNYVRKVGNDDFTFPLGQDGILMQIGISNATGTATTDVFEASYNRNTHPHAFWDSLSYGGDPGGMYNVSILDYWNLHRTNGSAQPFVRLYWSIGDSAQIDDLGDLVVAHYTGSNTWEDLGGNTTGTTASGYVESAARVTSFSPFTFGSSSSSSNPLPITLKEFKAIPLEDVVQIEWTTLEEINNDFFTIERSMDGKIFQEIGEVGGNGNHSGELNYTFTDNDPVMGAYSYYRLRQTDYDGNHSFSTIDAIRMDAVQKEKMVVFPNPALDQQVYINYPNVESDDVDIYVFDQMGNLISEYSFKAEEDYLLEMPTPSQSGLYILKLVSGNHTFVERLVVK